MGVKLKMEKNAILDNLASFMNEATSTAKGLGKEAQSVFNIQVEKALSKLDVVKSEEFEVLKERVNQLNIENEELKKRVAKLEEFHTI